MVVQYKTVVEAYPAGAGGITLHTYKETGGWKDESFYTTGMSGTEVPGWFQMVLSVRTLPVQTSFSVTSEKEVIGEQKITRYE